MQLKTQTDYAIRVLLYLAENKSCVSRKEMCTNLGIAETYLTVIVKVLRQKGWVSSTYGPNGGYYLICNPQNISLLDIMDVTEDSIKMNRCLEEDQYCSRNAVDYCPVHKMYDFFQDYFENCFSSVTIQDIIDPDSSVMKKKYLKICNQEEGERETCQ
ncbi:Rrf2 family transcriptional regulator [Blautia liquoris]|uniref:Rrf2 family transcriptional regulator n=1 Tax=Blautia liquoris TaxID=2779518 RepID=A0A7M2RDR0_9FIRM|nr:Rrf2 family transcriptional regulator [Blautia liquoris]QOV18121.1 Rrf2 family transcriptional regulator [Blautia liquoris]